MNRPRQVSRSKLRELRESRTAATSDDDDTHSSRTLDEDHRLRSSTPSKSVSDELTRVSRILHKGQSTLEETEENESSEATRRRASTSTRQTHSERRERADNLIREVEPGRRKRRSKKARRGQSLRSSGISDSNREKIASRSSSRHRGDGDVTDASRRRKSHQGDELPITEILKKSQENARAKYEDPVPLPQLSTDTIYIQGKNGFSAVKISGSSRGLKGVRHGSEGGFTDKDGKIIKDTKDGDDPPIRIAIAAQKLCKRTGLVYQGILGGMALMHFTVIQVLFNSTVEFIVDYSILSEIYTNVFSFLIVLCVVSAFDKFDVARLDMDHLREIYMDHAKTAIVVPLYVATFCLHQATSKTDEQLALVHYRSLNESIWHNVTNLEEVLLELNTWQGITMSKDILAVLAWVFISLGSRNDMLLSHLESMEQYAENPNAYK